MKTNILNFLDVPALSIMCAMVSHAQSVSSTPVGYVTIRVNAGTGSSLDSYGALYSFSGTVVLSASGTITCRRYFR